jgi:DnaD/phage-associated family protein
MKGFSGFPEGKLRLTSIPNLFFSDLLPNIDHIGELKVTLYAFWSLTQQDMPIRYLRLTDFLNDVILMDGMGPTPTLATENVIEGIERSVARGTFLHVSVESADGQTDLYFLNTPRGRAAVEGITRGEWRPALGHDKPISLLIERPNIFILYEQNIGALTPLIADELRDAERSYPLQWIEEAIQIAVNNNVRKWRYVQSILESWRLQGKDSGVHRQSSQTQRTRSIPDEYKDIVER